MTATRASLLSLLLCLPAAAADTSFKGAPAARPLTGLPGVAPLAATALPGAADVHALSLAAASAEAGTSAAVAASHPQAAVMQDLGRRSADVSEAVRSDASGVAAEGEFGRMYEGRRGGASFRGVPAEDGGRGRGRSRGRGRGRGSRNASFVVNDEGVEINERAANYYTRVRQLVAKYQGRLDFAESLDVMDDTYAQVWAKLAVIEAVAKRRNVGANNTHLEETLMWVDGVLDDNGKKVAIHTHQVYFHHSAEPSSEIAEGIRRVDKYIDKEALENFAPGGKAESHLGPLDEVVLAFDARGYKEIKDHLKQREKELSAAHGKRYRFVFLDEVAKVPQGKQATRDALNAQIKKYKAMYANAGSGLHGLQKIIEGVIYSRYVGVLLELATIDHYAPRGYTIEHSGRELFDEHGHYVTELDVVMRSPQGKLIVVEAKSARVTIPLQQALQDKVLYKLDTYKKHQALMEKAIGGPFDVIFSFDVGENAELAMMLKSEEEALSKRYGFKVSFIFISTRDGVAADDPFGAPRSRR